MRSLFLVALSVFILGQAIGNVPDTLNNDTLTEEQRIQNQISQIASNIRSSPEQAKKDALFLMDEFKNGESPLFELIVLNHLCRIEYILGNLSEALDYGFLALEKHEMMDIDHPTQLASVYNNMAHIYLEIGAQTKALEYYLLSIEMFEVAENPQNVGVLLGNIGNLYLDIGHANKAIEYYGQALEIFGPIEYLKGMAINNNNLGEAFLLLGDFDAALTHYQKANKLYNAIDDKRGIALDYILKPIDEDELITSINKFRSEYHGEEYPQRIKKLTDAYQKYNNQSIRIALPTMGGVEYVQINQIIYCEADNNYTIVHLDDGSPKVISKTLKYFENILGEMFFMRVHQSYLVNLFKVVRFEKSNRGRICLGDGTTINLSQNKKEEFLDKISKLTSI